MISFSEKIDIAQLRPDDKGWFNIDKRNGFRYYNYYTQNNRKSSIFNRIDIIVYEDNSQNCFEFRIKGNFIIVLRNLAQYLVNNVKEKNQVIRYSARTQFSLPKLKLARQPRNFLKSVMWAAGTGKALSHAPNEELYPDIIAYQNKQYSC